MSEFVESKSKYLGFLGDYFGYHRVSTGSQHLDRGIEEIEKFCADHGIMLKSPVFTDKQKGKTFDRPRYTVLKEDVLRAGDTLIITEVDRLGRNKAEILKELRYFKEKGVRVMILELPTTLIEVDTSNPFYSLILDTIQNMLIELFACFAEAELEKKNKRQAEGIQAMKARGEWDAYGRPHVCSDMEKFADVYSRVEQKELKVVEAAKELGMSVASFYRYKEKYLTEGVV